MHLFQLLFAHLNALTETNGWIKGYSYMRVQLMSTVLQSQIPSASLLWKLLVKPSY